jgi:hypothetical protein
MLHIFLDARLPDEVPQEPHGGPDQEEGDGLGHQAAHPSQDPPLLQDQGEAAHRGGRSAQASHLIMASRNPKKMISWRSKSKVRKVLYLKNTYFYQTMELLL